MASVLANCLIFLLPGAFGAGGVGSYFLEPDSYFAEYRRYFVQKGCQVQMAALHPDATIEERALLLKDQFERFRGTESGIILAHSQGGLDARYALKSLGLAGVRAVVTIGTPHFGTPLASWVLRQRQDRTWVYWILRVLVDYDLDALRFAGEMTPEFLEKHKERFAAVTGVRYASAAADCRNDCHRGFKWMQSWIGLKDGDGFVPVSSQVFGDSIGVYDLDHLSEIGTDIKKRPERAALMDRIWRYLTSL